MNNQDIKYRFQTGGENNEDCLEPCHIKQDIMIGSFACQRCQHCKGVDEVSKLAAVWITCERLDEALGKLDTTPQKPLKPNLKANELRIGNLYIHPLLSDPIKSAEDMFEDTVLVVNSHTIQVASRVGDDWVGKPLPISSDILEQFGFKYQHDQEEGWYISSGDIYSVRVWENGNGWFFSPSPDYSKSIKYVHQLQNIFFSLTETELIINLEDGNKI